MTINHDGNGNITTIVDATAKTFTFLRGAGKVSRVTEPFGREATFVTMARITFKAFGQLATRTNALPQTQIYTYDPNGPVRTTYPDGTYEENQWGCCVLERETDRMGRSTQYFYDALNRRIVTRDPRGVVTRFLYDANGHLTRLTDGNGNATAWIYDARDRMRQKVYADGTAWNYRYDAVGNLSERTDAKQVKTSYFYNQVNLLSSFTAPGISVSFGYDAADRRTEMNDDVGTTIWSYNDAGELTNEDGPMADDMVTNGYDNLGRRNSRAINVVNATWSYDHYGRPGTSVNPLGTFTHSYPNATSRLLSTVTSSGGKTTNFGYHPVTAPVGTGNGDRRLQSIWHKTNAGATISKFDYAYDVSGEITQWTQAAGAATPQRYDLSYDPAEQLLGATLRDTGSNAVIKSYGYTYDPAGNRTSEVIGTSVSKDTVNALNQLTVRAGGTVLPVRGTASEALATVTVNGAPATIQGGTAFEGSAQVTAGNNAVTVQATDRSGNATTKQYQVAAAQGSGKTLNYDLNGNLLSDGTRTFEWDALNRLTAVNVATHRSEFTYDGLHRRVQTLEKENGTLQTDRRYVWDGLAIVEERTETNIVTRRYYAEGALLYQPGSALQATYLYTRDHLGSVRELCDPAGNVQVRYDYDPYGRRTVAYRNGSAPDSEMTYTGHFYHAASGLFLAPYRAYDADLGRWLSRDPIAEDGGINLYAYVGNNPINLLDLLGLRPNSGTFWPAYPNYSTPASGVWAGIGGWLNRTYGPDSNSCAARVSQGLNRGGEPVRATPGVDTNRNDDGSRYIISAQQLRTYLNHHWGRPDRTISTPAELDALRRTLAPGQSAVGCSNRHAGVIRDGYTDDPYLPIGETDVWILPAR